MIKNIITFFLLLSSVILFAQNENCKMASDSVTASKERGELAYFYPAKYLADQYFYIVFKNNKYSKKQFPIGSLSKDFMTCFNQSSQKNLDSFFKIDFFRKTDSILNIYDNAGNGYRNTDFPGGAYALQTFLNKNVVLPEGARPKDADKFIRVYYSFVVDEQGVISDISLVKSNCKECEAAVLTAVQKLPNFIPATEAGKLKKLKYILPFMKKF